MGEKHSPCHSRHASELFAQIKCLCREDWVSRAKEARSPHRTRLSEAKAQRSSERCARCGDGGAGGVHWLF